MGRRDRIFPMHTGMALHQHWSGSNLVLSNAGHVTSVFLDDEVHVGTLLAAFGRANVSRPAPANVRTPPPGRVDVAPEISWSF